MGNRKSHENKGISIVEILKESISLNKKYTKKELEDFIVSNTNLKKDQFKIGSRWSNGYIVFVFDKRIPLEKFHKEISKVGLQTISIGIGYDYNLNAYRLLIDFKK